MLLGFSFMFLSQACDQRVIFRCHLGSMACKCPNTGSTRILWDFSKGHLPQPVREFRCFPTHPYMYTMLINMVQVSHYIVSNWQKILTSGVHVFDQEQAFCLLEVPFPIFQSLIVLHPSDFVPKRELNTCHWNLLDM